MTWRIEMTSEKVKPKWTIIGPNGVEYDVDDECCANCGHSGGPHVAHITALKVVSLRLKHEEADE